MQYCYANLTATRYLQSAGERNVKLVKLEKLSHSSEMEI
ncbi:hypothetical protein J2X05_002334 [Cellvibrio fibrivorans]|uniref:Uncharacterized protein n=1 Tax=Cellvibrio fibrivorans TaxID=126350 RepID=A0ABU1UYS9_9GAMM|nr:hypothetical protein [Cellvibrio fibrivorans]